MIQDEQRVPLREAASDIGTSGRAAWDNEDRKCPERKSRETSGSDPPMPYRRRKQVGENVTVFRDQMVCYPQQAV